MGVIPPLTDVLGWSAAALTLLAFSCNDLVRLRYLALSANAAFIAYGLTALGERPRIGLVTKALYGFGSIAFGIKDNGFRVFLLLFYNQVVGQPAGQVSAAVMNCTRWAWVRRVSGMP